MQTLDWGGMALLVQSLTGNTPQNDFRRGETYISNAKELTMGTEIRNVFIHLPLMVLLL